MADNDEQANNRRIFITNDNVDYYKLFSVSHNENDGSIYISWPNIKNTKWLIPSINEQKQELVCIDNPGEGKISFHGSGQTHHKTEPNIKNNRFGILGNELRNVKENVYGVRHLLTICHMEPQVFLSTSAARNRKTDYIMKTDKSVEPFFILLLAIPFTGLEVDLSFILSINDMEKVPDDILGFGHFPMKSHDILWIAYRNKYLKTWPPMNIVTFTNGYWIPLFYKSMGIILDVEYVIPTYSLSDNKLKIQIKSNRK